MYEKINSLLIHANDNTRGHMNKSITKKFKINVYIQSKLHFIYEYIQHIHIGIHYYLF